MTSLPLIVQDTEMWMQCCGKLPFNPAVGSMVYYFAEGHLEHMGNPGALESEIIDYEIPILCEIRSFSYLADQQTEEMFAEIVLKAVDGDREFPPFQLSEELRDGFYGKPLSKTNICPRLYVPLESRGFFQTPDDTGFFQTPDDKGSSLTLIDIANRSWNTKFMSASKKPGFYISGDWKNICEAKYITSEDSVYFKKLAMGTSFTFRRKVNFVADKNVKSKKKAIAKVLNCLDHVQEKKRFRVTFFPNWIDFLVDPAYLEACNQTLTVTDMRVKKRNTKLEGTLTEPVHSDEVVWKSIKVRWDGEGSAVSVNVWDVVPVGF